MIERSGHQVVLDHQGLAIDGQRICRTPLTPAQTIPPGQAGTSRAFQVADSGAVIYRGRIVAEIGPSPAGTANPGELTVHGPNGPEWYPPGAAERTRPPLPAAPSAAELQASVDEVQASVDQMMRRQQDEQDLLARAEEPGPQLPDAAQEMEISR
ncbi:hypothetical protein F7Q99_38990 [Streptomyces kaniharaensis]|uniref:Uncharacterized protein n=1 Tax=Streptomyces kaniharaensis TaxID=212423 RepID=A0A6N7L504_9ACTN|nr:hypothetical protein [Streptomyces kaniharaensis]MQS18019.1 hypothetical protein [Streptomyces kaniharaensis]